MQVSCICTSKMRRVGQVFRRIASFTPSVQVTGMQSSIRASYHTMGSSSSAAPVSARVCAKVQPVTLLESLPVYHNIIVRGFKNPKAPRGLKTKQCAAKRFIKTGSGKENVTSASGTLPYSHTACFDRSD